MPERCRNIWKNRERSGGSLSDDWMHCVKLPGQHLMVRDVDLQVVELQVCIIRHFCWDRLCDLARS